MLSRINFYKGLFRLWIFLYIIWIICVFIQFNNDIKLVYEYYFNYDEKNHEIAISAARRLDDCSNILNKKYEKKYINGLEIKSYDDKSYWCRILINDKLYSQTDIVIVEDVVSCIDHELCSDAYKTELSQRLKNLNNEILNRRDMFRVTEERKELFDYFIIFPIASLVILCFSIFSLKYICRIIKWIYDGFLS